MFSKNSIILPCFSYKVILLHKGHLFKQLYINLAMIGFRYGNFAITRKPFYFPIKVQKKKRK
jgi:ribosomal protein S19